MMVYILILHYGKLEDTLECINSVMKSSFQDFKIVIINNDEDNEIYKTLLQLENTNPYKIKIINIAKNIGYAAGNNEGIKLAISEKAKYIWILNNDTIVDKDALKYLLFSIEQSKEYGIASSTIYYYNNPNKIWVAGGSRKYSFLDIITSKFGYYSDRDYFQSDAEGEKLLVSAVGTSMLIKTDLIKDIGLIPEEYFLYREDTDFCLSAIKKGWKIIYSERSRVYHKYKDNEPSPTIIYYFVRNTLILIKKHYNYMILILSNIFVPIVYFSSVLFIYKNKKNLYKNIKAVIRGYLDFLIARR
ncbi:MAG: glycosyltransferase family 2 protein [Candidatus Micrarchaeaceae archaeon]